MAEPTLWRATGPLAERLGSTASWEAYLPAWDDYLTLAPVAADAVFAEDRGQAVERMLPTIKAIIGDVLGLESLPSREHLLRLGYTDGRLRHWADNLLAAAEGRET